MPRRSRLIFASTRRWRHRRATAVRRRAATLGVIIALVCLATAFVLVLLGVLSAL